MQKIGALILAAGSGIRFDHSGPPKQFQSLQEFPVFLYSLRSLLQVESIGTFLVVVPESYLDLARSLFEKHRGQIPNATEASIQFTSGGETRFYSSLAGLEWMEKNYQPSRVLIHDGCRPYLAKKMLLRLGELLRKEKLVGAIPVIPMSDTLRNINSEGSLSLVARERFFRTQTPQIFDFKILLDCYRQAVLQKRVDFSDDASVLEHFGQPIMPFDGDTTNIKLTYPSDLLFLNSLMEA